MSTISSRKPQLSAVLLFVVLVLKQELHWEHVISLEEFGVNQLFKYEVAQFLWVRNEKGNINFANG